ncbi:hypothetical protein HK104_006152 [Borealophlyctis nickersoniae]|nr:hypothetical protein HK104_006152 [Borealophlyctis nickersoniae]
MPPNSSAMRSFARNTASFVAGAGITYFSLALYDHLNHLHRTPKVLPVVEITIREPEKTAEGADMSRVGIPMTEQLQIRRNFVGENAPDFGTGKSENQSSATPKKSNPTKRVMEVQYPVIGDRHVAVPTHLFKGILAIREPQKEGDTKEVQFAAFAIPNERIPENTPLKAFQISKDELERLAGFRIFERVLSDGVGSLEEQPKRNSLVKDLCASHGCEMMTPEKRRLYFLTRDMKNAKTLDRVETTLAKLKTQNLVPDGEFVQIFLAKMEQLGQEDVRARPG